MRRSSAPLSLGTDRTIIRRQRVDIAAPTLLADVSRSQVLRLDLFPDVTLRALRTRVDATLRGTSWTGVLQGYPGSSATFAFVGDELVGHITAPFGVFNIQSAPDGSYVVQQIDERLLGSLDDDARIGLLDSGVSDPRVSAEHLRQEAVEPLDLRPAASEYLAMQAADGGQIAFLDRSHAVGRRAVDSHACRRTHADRDS